MILWEIHYVLQVNTQGEIYGTYTGYVRGIFKEYMQEYIRNIHKHLWYEIIRNTEHRPNGAAAKGDRHIGSAAEGGTSVFCVSDYFIP